MNDESPIIVIVDSSSNELVVQSGTLLTNTTPGVPVFGKNEFGKTQFIPVVGEKLPVLVTSLPLPNDAATETTLLTRAGEHTTAISPHSVRLTDGSVFYEALTNTQLRTSPIPVSGVVTATITTISGLALDATLTNRTQKTIITDGINDTVVMASGISPTIADSAVVVSISPNSASHPVTITSDKLLDGFGRLTVATPTVLFESKLLVDADPLHWDDQQTSGAGTTSTYNSNQSSQTLAVGATTTGTRVRQTFSRWGYQSDKSQGIVITGILGTPATGITRRIGQFDSNNGVFFESNSTVVRVVHRTFTSGSAVDTAINQSSWNLDKMDGTGASHIILDFSKTQIFCFQYQWLGVGSIWYGVSVNGIIYWVHRTDNANSLSLVWMTTPNLPLRFEISNDGTGGAASLLQICAAIFSNGGIEDIGISRTIYRDTAFVGLNSSAWFPLLAVRIATGRESTRVKIKKLSINCQSTADYTWRLVLNPTVVGTAFTFASLSNSSIEYVNANTNATTITGGTDIDSETTQQSTGSAVPTFNVGALRLGFTIAGVSDILVLAVRRETGGIETYSATMTMLESI